MEVDHPGRDWPVGYSTGALAYGDVESAIARAVQLGCEAIEISLLRFDEFLAYAGRLGDLDVSSFARVTLHAPKYPRARDVERAVASALRAAPDWPVVLHPDRICDAGVWREFGELLLIENLDRRVRTFATAEGILDLINEDLPDASVCFDVAHAYQVDKTFSVARALVTELGSRIRQVHMSELDAAAQHCRTSSFVLSRYAWLLQRLGRVEAVICEAVPESFDEARCELHRVRASLGSLGPHVMALPS